MAGAHWAQIHVLREFYPNNEKPWLREESSVYQRLLSITAFSP